MLQEVNDEFHCPFLEASIMLKKSLVTLGIGVVVGCGTYTLSQEPKPAPQQKKDDIPQVTKEHPVSFWMERKLELSKSILESLTKADFAALEKSSEQLRVLGKMEAFVRRKNDDYRAQLRNFELATNDLIRQSKRKNAEGATLAFNQLTTSCVACHVIIRENPTE